MVELTSKQLQESSPVLDEWNADMAKFANQVPDTEISSTNLNTGSVAMNDDATAGGENADLTTEEL